MQLSIHTWVCSLRSAESTTNPVCGVDHDGWMVMHGTCATLHFIFHMNAFFLSNHLIYQLLKNWFLISCVLFYVDEVSGWWFGVWNLAKSMMVT